MWKVCHFLTSPGLTTQAEGAGQQFRTFTRVSIERCNIWVYGYVTIAYSNSMWNFKYCSHDSCRGVRSQVLINSATQLRAELSAVIYVMRDVAPIRYRHANQCRANHASSVNSSLSDDTTPCAALDIWANTTPIIKTGGKLLSRY